MSRLREVTLTLCRQCEGGAGGECHTPGCALWKNRAPDVPLAGPPGEPAHRERTERERLGKWWWRGDLSNADLDAAKYPGEAGDCARARIARAVLDTTAPAPTKEEESK